MVISTSHDSSTISSSGLSKLDAREKEVTNTFFRTITTDAVVGLGLAISRRIEATGLPVSAASSSPVELLSTGLHSQRVPGAMLPSGLRDEDILNDRRSLGSFPPWGRPVKAVSPIVPAPSQALPLLACAASDIGKDSSRTRASKAVRDGGRTGMNWHDSGGSKRGTGCSMELLLSWQIRNPRHEHARARGVHDSEPTAELPTLEAESLPGCTKRQVNRP